METIRVNGHLIEFYNSVYDMPFENYTEFNVFAAIEAAAGEGLEGYTQKLTRVMALIRSGKTDDAITELQNAYQSVYFVLNKLNPEMLAFAAFVKSIDGVPQTDITESGLKAVLSKLKRVQIGLLKSIYDSLKKKIQSELKQIGKGADDFGFYSELIKEAKKLAQSIIDGTEANNIDQNLLVYGGAMSIASLNPELNFRHNLETIRAALASKLNVNIKGLTVFQVLTQLDNINQFTPRQ